MELPQPEVGPSELGGTVDDDLDCRTQVLELDGLLRDVDDRLLGCESNSIICYALALCRCVSGVRRTDVDG